jgi:hypothetical protein
MPTSIVPRPVPPAPATVPPAPASRRPLDLCLGERDAARCGGCARELAPIADRQKFELVDADTDEPLCDVCASRQNRPLRLAVALLNAMIEAYAAGDKKAASEAVEAVANGFSMLQAEAPRVVWRPQVRHQPTRHKPRRNRKK